MTLNELLERKRREFDDTRALLNELAGDCFLSKEDPSSNTSLLEISEKVNELSIEILFLENCQEFVRIDQINLSNKTD